MYSSFVLLSFIMLCSNATGQNCSKGPVIYIDEEKD